MGQGQPFMSPRSIHASIQPPHFTVIQPITGWRHAHFVRGPPACFVRFCASCAFCASGDPESLGVSPSGVNTGPRLRIYWSCDVVCSRHLWEVEAKGPGRQVSVMARWRKDL